jgi:hypothetical protein
LLIEENALMFLSSLAEKSQRIIKERCRALANDPFPGKDDDKEALHLPGFRKLYRLHVGAPTQYFITFLMMRKLCEYSPSLPLSRRIKCMAGLNFDKIWHR